MEEEPPPGVDLHLRAVALAVGAENEAVFVPNRLVSPVRLPGETGPSVGVIKTAVVHCASASPVFPAILRAGEVTALTLGVLVVAAVLGAGCVTVHVYFVLDVALQEFFFLAYHMFPLRERLRLLYPDIYTHYFRQNQEYNSSISDETHVHKLVKA